LLNDEFQQAMQSWVKVYRIARKIDLAQVLDALESLADNLGMEDGLASWEKLAGNDDEL
jgi:hypothetical protein